MKKFGKIEDGVSPWDGAEFGTGTARIQMFEVDDSGAMSCLSTDEVVTVRNEHNRWFPPDLYVELRKDQVGLWRVYPLPPKKS